MYCRPVQRLYHRVGAGRPPRVRWALEEAGASYDHVVMSTEEGRAEEHAKRHPLGRVPVLETEDGLLFESAGLCLHVADSHPEAGLIPEPGSFERAQVYQWAFFAMTELEATVIRALLARQRGDATAVEKADARLDKTYRALADALDGRDYLVGNRFTIADVVVGGVLESARRYQALSELPEVRGYLERLDQRPAKQRAYSD
jgi:glutathione S-transferase